MLIPRDDPAGLDYTVMIRPAVGEDPRSVATVLAQLSAMVQRGPAWQLDFPSAQAKVRGCDGAGDCIDSNQQPLQSVLVGGVIPIALQGSAPNAHVAMRGDGNLLVAKNQFSLNPPGVQVYIRDELARWLPQLPITSDEPGFGRSFALSLDGMTLAVEVSLCAVNTIVCDASAVIVYRRASIGADWVQETRIEGMRAPKLSQDGNRVAGIGIPSLRGNTVVVFARGADATWSQLQWPNIDYQPLDLEFSADGFTIAVSRAGTLANPCGCRAVVVYRCGAGGWQQSATLHSSKRPDPAGTSNDDGFGFATAGSHSLAVSGDGRIVAVGASLDDSDASDTVGDPANHEAPDSGAIYVFQRNDDGTWAQQAFLKPRGAAANDHFGHLVAITSAANLIYGGARGLAANAAGIHRNQAGDQPLPSPTPDMNGALAGAAAYVFEHTASGWLPRAAAVAPPAAGVDFDTQFALAISADGSTLVLGTGAHDAAAPGGVTRTLFVY